MSRKGPFTPQTLRLFMKWVMVITPCSSGVAWRPVQGDQDATVPTSDAGPTGSSPDDLSRALDEEFRELLRVKHEEAKDVFIDDLSATLEAHRATNRAKIVRKLNQKANWEPPFKNPLADGVATSSTSAVQKEDRSNLIDEQGAEVAAKPLLPLPWIKHSDDGGIGTPSEVAGNSHGEKHKTGGHQRDPNEDVHRDKHWPADSIQNEQYWRNIKGSALHEIQEYKAMYIHPRGDFNSEMKVNKCLWLDGLGTFATAKKASKEVPSSRRLHDEIIAYEKYMKMNPVEEEAARLFTMEVKSIVCRTYPKNPLIPIGSHSTGLADRLSDFDFTLSFPDLEKSPLERGPSSTRPLARKAGRSALWAIYRSLYRSSQFQEIELIHARVPIIKAIHTKTRFRVELQTLSSSHEASREYSMYYQADFPTLRPLYILFRSALHIRHLNIVHEGGLGSYSTLMMIVNALKHASGKYAQNDLVGHFLHILDFYGNANLYRIGFSPDPPRTFKKTRGKISAEDKIASMQDPVLQGIDTLRKLDPKKPYLLCLQDPANAVNDLGCKAYGIKHIQELFRVIRKDLTANMKAWDGNGDFKEPWHAQGLLAPLLAADYSKLEGKRRRVEKWVVKKNTTFRNHPSIIDRQYQHQEFHQSNMPLTEPQNISSPPQHSTYEARDSGYTVLESTSGELRVSTDGFVRAADGSVDGVDTNQHSVTRDHESHARSYAEPDIHTILAVDKDQSNQHSESSSPIEPVKAAQIQRGVLPKESTTQQDLPITEQGNMYLAIDKDQSHKHSESSPSTEPPKTIKIQPTTQTEGSPTTKGLQSTGIGNGHSGGRKEWSLPAVNKWKKWEPANETMSRPEGDQQDLKVGTAQTDNSRAGSASFTSQKAEATGRGEMLSQPGRLEPTPSTAMGKRNLSRRPVKAFDALPPTTIKGLPAVQTGTPNGDNKRAVSTNAPYIISGQSKNQSLELTPPLTETQAAMSQDEHSTARGSAPGAKAWKTLNDGTEVQIKRVESVKRKKSNHHVANEDEERVDHGIGWHPAPGEDSTSNHGRNAETGFCHAIEKFYNALHAITDHDEAQATFLSKVAIVDRKLDPDEFLKLEKDESTMHDEFQPNQYYRFRLVKWKMTEGDPEKVSKENATTTGHIRFMPQMRLEDKRRRLPTSFSPFEDMGRPYPGAHKDQEKDATEPHLEKADQCRTENEVGGVKSSEIDIEGQEQPQSSHKEPASKSSSTETPSKNLFRVHGKFSALENFKALGLTYEALQLAATDTPHEQTKGTGAQSLTPTPPKPMPPISNEGPITPEKRKARNKLTIDPKNGRKANEQKHKVRVKGKGSTQGGQTVGKQERWKERVTKKMIRKEAREKQQELSGKKSRKRAEDRWR
ncbi:hypothetical protein G7Y79_00003g011340 [Physcia stellaris]|nr:hypothetical protein G7Y79_00003g011340 [Physcia stellaris]